MEGSAGVAAVPSSCCWSPPGLAGQCHHPCLGRGGPLRAPCVVAEHCSNVRVLRRGRHSTISRADCDALGGPIVLKTYDCANIAPKKQKMAAREAVMLQLLNVQGVPNITQCWGACHYQGHLHILMEHCEGGDLLSVLGRQGTGFCEEVVACVFAVPLLRSLAAMHALGVIHRDIKLENIFLDGAGRPKLGDLDMAVLATEPAARAPVGTIFYMAPEVMMLSTCRGGPADAALIRRVNEKMDIWSLGVCLFELAAGYKPYQGVSYEGVAAALVHRHRAELPHHLSPGFRAFIDRMLCYDVDARPSAAQLLDDPWLLEVAPAALRSDSARSLQDMRSAGGPAGGPKGAMGGAYGVSSDGSRGSWSSCGGSSAHSGGGSSGGSSSVVCGGSRSCSIHDLCAAFNSNMWKLQTTLGAHFDWGVPDASPTLAAATAAAAGGAPPPGTPAAAAAAMRSFASMPQPLRSGAGAPRAGSDTDTCAAVLSPRYTLPAPSFGPRRASLQAVDPGAAAAAGLTVTSDAGSTLGHPIVGTPHHMRLHEPMWTPFACPVQQFRVQQLLLTVAPVTLPPEEEGLAPGYSRGMLDSRCLSHALPASSAFLEGSQQLSSALPEGATSCELVPGLLQPQEGGCLPGILLEEALEDCAAADKQAAAAAGLRAALGSPTSQAAEVAAAAAAVAALDLQQQQQPQFGAFGSCVPIEPASTSGSSPQGSQQQQVVVDGDAQLPCMVSVPCTPSSHWPGPADSRLVTPISTPVTPGDGLQHNPFGSTASNLSSAGDSPACTASIAMQGLPHSSPRSPSSDAVITLDPVTPSCGAGSKALPAPLLQQHSMGPALAAVAAAAAARAAAASTGGRQEALLRGCHSDMPGVGGKLAHASSDSSCAGQDQHHPHHGLPLGRRPPPRRKGPFLFACFRGTLAD